RNSWQKVAPSAGSANALAKAYKQDVLRKLYEAEETFRKDLEAVEKTLDPLIRQYKVKALDMTLARFEKYRQRAISARFIVISTQSSISSASSTATTTDSISTKESSRNDGRPLDSSDISWKLLPKWDANWKKERDLEAFLKNMSNFRTMMEEAQEWNEMQTRFKDWQAPPLDELIQQAIEEQRLHPQDTGTGRYQRAVSFWTDIAYSSEVIASQRSKNQQDGRKDVSLSASENVVKKRSYQDSGKAKQDDNTGTGSFVPIC
ncbi:hypothetical protein BGX29_003101, partial [Mortierella sp. GBA35]